MNNIFVLYNANPKKRRTPDCVVRAISTVTNQDYCDVVMDLAKLQCEYGYDIGDRKLYNKYLSKLGWIKYKLNKKYTAKKWCETFTPEKAIIHVGEDHLAAVINGKVFDTWDCTDYYIDYYWIKEM